MSDKPLFDGEKDIDIRSELDPDCVVPWKVYSKNIAAVFIDVYSNIIQT